MSDQRTCCCCGHTANYRAFRHPTESHAWLFSDLYVCRSEEDCIARSDTPAAAVPSNRKANQP